MTSNEEKRIMALSPYCIYDQNQIQEISVFKDKFKNDVKIVNFFKRKNNNIIQPVDGYDIKTIDVVLANANLDERWVDETIVIKEAKKLYMYVDSLRLFIENGSLEEFYENCIGGEEDKDDDNPNNVDPRKKSSLGCNAFHKTVIMIIHLFMLKGSDKMKYIDNARNKVIQNLLMMDYDDEKSIIRDIYNFPFLTYTNVKSLVHNESSRLRTIYKESDREEAIILSLVDSFAQIKEAKNPCHQIVTILNTFRDLGFKKVSITFDIDNKKFIFDIKDFDADVFHQDHDGLKDVYSDMMDFLCHKINQLGNLKKDFPRTRSPGNRTPDAGRV
jgi:hypothetical protein